MPLLITPAAPFATTAELAVPAVYALIRRVNYDTDAALIAYDVSYYVSQPARAARAATLQITALPPGFSQAATPQEANAMGIFQFLEMNLTQQLTALLPAGTTFANVA